jgi:hypothetical protein
MGPLAFLGAHLRSAAASGASSCLATSQFGKAYNMAS